jgi:adenylate cyclase
LPDLISPISDSSDADPDGAWLESSDGQRWTLQGKCSLGRGPESHIFIDSPKTSRRHAVIHLQDEVEFWLVDLVSRNGTYCNERRVVRPTRLRHGDTVSIGGQTFLFQQPGQARRRTDDTPTHFTTSGGDATVLDLRQQSVWLLIGDIDKFSVLCQEWDVDKLALSVGRWLRESLRIVEKHGGRISKYLGDGFLACWEDRGETTNHVVDSLREFQRLRKDSAVNFRVALHHGLVTFGEQSEWGEQSILGPEMNYIFRLEDLASTLGVAFCLSSSAQAKLAPLIAIEKVPGEHELKGYAGTHRCFSIAADL